MPTTKRVRISRAAAAAVLAWAGVPAFAGGTGLFGGFYNNATTAVLKPFALDLGGLMGGQETWNGRSLGLLGFEVEPTGLVQAKADKNDAILKSAVGSGALGLPFLNVAVGLPMKFDVAAHGMAYDGATILGGGLRYSILRSGMFLRFIPNLGVSVFGDELGYSDFSATHYGFNAAASWDIPIIAPFVEAGLDRTTLKATAAGSPGAVGNFGPVEGTRYEVGVDFKPLPLFNITLAYLSIHGIPSGTAQVGVRF